MKHYSAKKLALAGMFCAVAVVGSVFSFPVFGSKCAPVQHMVNILCAVLLGPYYGSGQSDGFPRQHVRRTALRHRLPQDQ